MQVGRRVEHVGGDDDVELTHGEALCRGITLDVERAAEDCRVVDEAFLGARGEQWRDVGEPVLAAPRRQPGPCRHRRRRRPAPDLEDADRPVGRKPGDDRGDGIADERVEHRGGWGVAIDLLGGLLRAAGEQQLQRLGGAR